MLELSGLFVCLEGMGLEGRGILSFSVLGGTEKVAGLWYKLRGISTQADIKNGNFEFFQKSLEHIF